MHAAWKQTAAKASAPTGALELQDLSVHTTPAHLSDDCATPAPESETRPTARTMAVDVERPDSEGCHFESCSTGVEGRDQPAQRGGVLTAAKETSPVVIPSLGQPEVKQRSHARSPLVAVHCRSSVSSSYAYGLRTTDERRSLFKLGFSFFLFGLINNVLYVIILSAALDLVPPSTPKGIIAFCNIAPALLAKLAWPYYLKGRIRYAKRVVGCCILSFVGMLFVAFHESLGEITFLQLSSTYSTTVGGHGVGYFASGTGAAGLAGAFLWWELRGLGVKTGVGISSVLPFALPVTYFFILPRPSSFYDAAPSALYSALPVDDTEASTMELPEDQALLNSETKTAVFLTAADKWRLLRPMIFKYMLPLCECFSFCNTATWLIYEYTINQLVYQTTVFMSRSTISLGIPPLPTRLLPLPAVVQLMILITLAYESAVGIFAEDHEGWSILFVFILISIEGICGGLAYVNVFYRINQERPDPSTVENEELAKQECEFKMGSLGFSDSSGILFASLLAMPTEIELCKLQVARGKLLCQGL
ncbi:hypothetical protein ID866_5619 [Astraeus odoratus]|nr:hypothetical protein ID866_5619 [Astraeus odoratus]